MSAATILNSQNSKNAISIQDMIFLKEDIVLHHRETDGIPRVDGASLSYQEFVERMVANSPVIIRLDLSSWDSFSCWFREDETLNTEYLRSVAGEVEVPVAKCSQQYFNSHVRIEMKLSEFLDKWDSNSTEGLYLKDWHLRNQKPEYSFYRTPEFFCSDFLNEYLVATGQEDYKFVYIGKRGTYTPLHSDVFSSFSWSVNLRGLKRWYILPAGEEEKLRDPLGNLPFLLTPELLDERHVKYYEVLQESQEAIFVPSNWFHQVHNEADTVSVNHNWFNSCNLGLVWEALKTNAEKVKNEIRDCRDMEDFEEHCQVMLKSHFGMNFREFLDLLQFVSARRISSLKAKSPLEVLDGFEIDEGHIRFDLKRIREVAQKIRTDSDVIAVDLVGNCDTLLASINEVIGER